MNEVRDTNDRIVQKGDFCIFAPSTRGSNVSFGIYIEKYNGNHRYFCLSRTRPWPSGGQDRVTLGRIKKTIMWSPRFRVTMVEDFLPKELVGEALALREEVIQGRHDRR